ncbi:hypothetical protein [Streptomyces sp. NPDC091217]|uniref:hypothetical protein n=1 Tax=Streptomyces sp. NPDC091217 TaxID=3365975 RepID=UPI003824CC9E
MDRWDPWDGSEEWWCCPWCYATTCFNVFPFQVCRPPYKPLDLRWEAAATELLPDAPRHAYGYNQRTLCGIEKPDMRGSPYGLWGGFPEDCLDCVALAKIIDTRWPIDRRDDKHRQSIRVDEASLPGAGS